MKPAWTGLLTIATLLPILGLIWGNTLLESSAIAAAPPQPKSVGTIKPDSSWKTFTSPQGRYSITMPGQPKILSKDLKLNDDETTQMWFAVGQESENSMTFYASAYMDFPLSGSVDKSLAQSALDAGIQNLINSGNRQELGRSRFALDGHPAQEVRYRSPRGTGRARAFLVKNRLYILMVETDREAENQAKMTDFLQSFKLLK
jgi:hypothetical protein